VVALTAGTLTGLLGAIAESLLGSGACSVSSSWIAVSVGKTSDGDVASEETVDSWTSSSSWFPFVEG
jgi:hypothetical protein